MTGPRSSPVHPHRYRARRLLPFLAAIILGPLACSDQPTAPQTPGAGPSPAATRSHPYLASKSGQTARVAGSSMQMAMSRTTANVAAANLELIAAPKVLILSDVDGPTTTALANSIVSAGFHVGLVRAPEYNWFGTNPSLDGYDAVIHLNGFTYNLPLAANTQTALSAFVSNGGGFVGAQWNGYEEVAGQQTGMSGLVLLGTGDANSDSCGLCTVTYTTVAGQESHPVLEGLPSSFTFFADGHDASARAVSDPATVVLMQSPSGGPAVLVGQAGTGKVVNFSFAPNYADVQADRHTLEDANVQQLYINAVRWMSGSQGIPGGGSLDRDADGVVDATDNCISEFNPAQLDTDADGLGDACDPDIDGDGVLNDDDNCELYNPDQADLNQNWIGDACEVVQTQPQTITFAPILDRTILEAPFTVSASASSELEVTFLFSGTCTMSGTTVTATGIGTCTIFAQQGGNADFSAAPTVEQSFNITKAPATITLGTEYTFDGTVKYATVTTNPAGLSGVSVIYRLGGSAVPEPVNAGVYQVFATLDHATYEAPLATGTLTINPAIPVINWTSPDPITVGTPLGATQFNATASGVGGSSLSGTFVYLPIPGTVLTIGAARPISVEFIPSSGNYTRARKTVSIAVLALPVPPSTLRFAGFFKPVHNLPAVNRVVAGRAIPVKFAVEGSRALRVLRPGAPTSVPASCGSAGAERSVEETVTAAASRLVGIGHRYTYVWKTTPAWAGTCRKLIVTLVDGSTHEALFHFVKEDNRKDEREHGKSKQTHEKSKQK